MKLLTSFLLALTISTGAWALAPEIEVDRLLLQAKAALDGKDYAQATESLNKAETLGVKLPDTFYYHYGRAYAGIGKLEQGRAMLERYLNLSGTKGKFYLEALVGMNEIEVAIKKKSAEDAFVAQESAAKAEKDALSRNGGFVNLGGGILKDTKTGLEWTQSENGSEINFSDAKQFCVSRGAGWRLPSLNELQRIYDSSGSVKTSCEMRDGCNVSPLFHLDGSTFWSGTPSFNNEFWTAWFSNGQKLSNPGFMRNRALCVRRP